MFELKVLPFFVLLLVGVSLVGCLENHTEIGSGKVIKIYDESSYSGGCYLELDNGKTCLWRSCWNYEEIKFNGTVFYSKPSSEEKLLCERVELKT